MKENIYQILEKARQKIDLNKEEIIKLLNLEDNDSNELDKTANEIRKENCGDEVHMRGILDISNYCEENCMYCERREDNFSLKRYRMSPDEIIESAKQIVNMGVKTIVIQSGEDNEYDTDILAYIIYTIKHNTDAAITLSLGERGLDEYRAWKIAGADRYLMKHETANPKKYAIYRNRKLLNDRVQQLKYLKRLGYQIGSGNIVGLPLQKIDDIADDIILCRFLDVDLAIFDPFYPFQFTPYQNKSAASLSLTLKTIATARLVLPDVHIPAPAYLDNLYENGFEQALKCGANSVLPNYTPCKYLNEAVSESLVKQPKSLDTNTNFILQNRIEAIGRRISSDRGDSFKSKNNRRSAINPS